MPKPVYRLSYFFDYHAGGCLWPSDDVTWETFGAGPVDHDERIGLSASLLQRIVELDARYPQSLNWDDPGAPSPWTSVEWAQFKKQVDALYEDLLVALSPGCELKHKHTFQPDQGLQFSEIDYSPAQQALLRAYEQTGIVVDTVILQPDTLSKDRYQMSKMAALSGMQVFADRYVRHFEQHHPGKDMADYFSIRIEPGAEPSGQHIAFDEFLGPGFDIAADRLRLFSYNPETGILYHPVTEGFAKALLEPPHPIVDPGDPADPAYLHQITQDLTRLLRDYLREILHVENLNETEHLLIYAWSDDWSNYFDAGKEWWGTFFWTVYDINRQTIAVIGASDTD